MKPYMSYWSGGYRKIPDQYTINLHKLSAHHLKKNFGEVHLITDENGADALKDIPWSSVALDLQNLDKNYSRIWSTSKLLAYKIISEMGDPFIHVDYDCILWHGIEERLKKSSIFAQSIEIRSAPWYKVKDIKACLSKYDFFSRLPDNLDAINVGVFGGNDLKNINGYAQGALDFVFNVNYQSFWNNFNFHTNHDNCWHRACIAEQLYLSAYCFHNNLKVDFVFEDGITTEDRAKQKQYTHLMLGKQKEKNKILVEQLVKTLKL